MLRSGSVARDRCIASVFVSGIGLAGAIPAAVEINNPPVLQDERAPIAKPALKKLAPAAPLPGSTEPVRGDRQLNLKIDYIDNQIYNPSKGGYDKVHLRGYTGKGVDPKAPYVSPTIEAIPGDTVRITLDNTLAAGSQPGDPGCMPGALMPDIPHCFNGTNLHSHGLWVSPTGNSDNVLLSINPQTQFTYEYNIPSDHPSGTFSYHTHRHGSTALQVSSGMAELSVAIEARIQINGLAGPVFDPASDSAAWRYARGELGQRMDVDVLDEPQKERLRYSFRELYKLSSTNGSVTSAATTIGP
jgi:FtsP/CotA-like multicopper oxidase with cupredoxin domain